MGFKEPKIRELDQLILAGFNFYGDPFTSSTEWTEENEIGLIWRRFKGYLRNNNERVQGIFKADAAYEVHLWSEDTPKKGHFDVFVGQEVTGLKTVPHDLLARMLPPCKYAVFTLKGDEISSDWCQALYFEWLPHSGYQSAYNYLFQYLDRRFKGVDRLEDSELDLYIPIVRA